MGLEKQLTLFAEMSGSLQWLSEPWVRWPLNTVYLIALLLLSLYGMHRYWLLVMYLRQRGGGTPEPKRFDDLPRVTVQLPMYNEPRVAERVIDAACRLDYPRDRLQVQVIDDSDDGSAAVVQRCVEHWRQQGVDISWVRRSDRRGYKAGALAAAMPAATGAFIAIFDADFMPQPDFLQQVIHHFTDEGVGMVQARWEHANRHQSMLTRAQAVFLDGHFVIEHAARHGAGRWFNFNGTAGVWRRTAIDDAGGWEGDTLTEDVDLSYRAQLAGWRFVYLPDVACAAELPPEINAFKAQQHRWAKGSIQCAIKLLGRVMRSDASPAIKFEVFMHLLGPLAYVAVTVMALLLFPAIYVNFHAFISDASYALLFGLAVFALGTMSAGLYFAASQRARGSTWLVSLGYVPVLMFIGIGVALNSARGVIEALLGMASPFVRTPKYDVAGEMERNAEMATPTPSPSEGEGWGEGVAQVAAEVQGEVKRASTDMSPTPKSKAAPTLHPSPSLSPEGRGIRSNAPRSKSQTIIASIEIALGLYAASCAVLAMSMQGKWLSVPFLALFAVGYLYVGITSLAAPSPSRVSSDSTATKSMPQPNLVSK